MNEIKQIFGTVVVTQYFELEQSGQQHGKIADEKMSCDGILFLQIHWSCVQLRFHDTEGFFYPPEIMIRLINFFVTLR